VTIAFSLLIDNEDKPSKRNMNLAIALLTFAAVVFRAEIVMLLAPIALQALYLRHITFLNLFIVGLASGLASLRTFQLIYNRSRFYP
jgi:alpha-1,6-mannosyltransferase